MIAQRNQQAEILAIDISESAAVLARDNFKRSPYAERIAAQCIDYKLSSFKTKFDLIVCNPPFFEPNSSTKDRVARQTLELDAESFLSKSAELLVGNGRVSVIIPADQFELYLMSAKSLNLFLIRRIDIYGIENGAVKRNILEFSKIEGKVLSETFVIEKSPRKYSDQYLELTKEFHVFGK